MLGSTVPGEVVDFAVLQTQRGIACLQILSTRIEGCFVGTRLPHLVGVGRGRSESQDLCAMDVAGFTRSQ
jgi:hypothetical protein